MAHLDRRFERAGHHPAAVDPVVDRREAVEHGLARNLGFLNAPLRVLIAVQTGIAVDGGGQQVRLAVLLQVAEQGDVLIDERHPCPRLDQGLFGGDGLVELVHKALLRGDGLLVSKGFLKVHLSACRPAGQHRLALGHEEIQIPFLI